jgi:hypothetical protein
MLVLVLVFGMTVVGCEEEEEEPSYIEIQNGTTFNITKVVVKTSGDKVIVSDNSGITASASKKFDIDAVGNAWVTVTVNTGSELVEVESSGIVGVSSSKGDYLQAKLLLSGTDKDTLKLQ